MRGLYVLGAVLAASISLRAAPAFAIEPYEVDVGLWTCPRGYQIQTDGTCKSDSELPHGPVVEISSLPSAGDGAPTICPSGGCDSLLAPLFFSIYSAPTLGYSAWSWPYYGGWSSWPYYGRWTWPYYRDHVRHRFHDESAFRTLPRLGFGWRGFQSGPHHFRSFSARGSQARSLGGRFLGGTMRGTSGHGVGRGRTWR